MHIQDFGHQSCGEYYWHMLTKKQRDVLYETIKAGKAVRWWQRGGIYRLRRQAVADAYGEIEQATVAIPSHLICLAIQYRQAQSLSEGAWMVVPSPETCSKQARMDVFDWIQHNTEVFNQLMVTLLRHAPMLEQFPENRQAHQLIEALAPQFFERMTKA